MDALWSRSCLPSGLPEAMDRRQLWPVYLLGTSNRWQYQLVQNGLLLRSDLHDGFDQYLFSINPRANYKVIVLVRYSMTLMGLTLTASCFMTPAVPRMNSFGGILHKPC